MNYLCLTYIYITQQTMLKDFFQKHIDLQNQLRSQFFKTNEYLLKGKYRMKQKFFGGGKKHYDFDINSQEYFHQYVDDIIFESPQIQDVFFNHICQSLQQPLQMNKQITEKLLPTSKNPYETRLQLARFFRLRIQELQYKKYLLMLRVHNSNAEAELEVVKNRIFLIDKQIESAINRQSRLSCDDQFQQSYTVGGKPVPVNENGQPIYKYLDEQQCWFSNISREDILVFSRNRLYVQEMLDNYYWPCHYELTYLVTTHGIEIFNAIQQKLANKRNKLKKTVESESMQFLSTIQKCLQQISPGNLIAKENINNFIFFIFGVNQKRYINVPLHPAIFEEMFVKVNQVIPTFLKNLQIKTHSQLINLLPKFNTFSSILFKYQNKEILQGKKEIKLGLQDDIDVRKELITMLQQLWVHNHVNISFQRFDYKMYLRNVDWPLDTISNEKQRQHKRAQQKIVPDRPIEQLIHLASITDYKIFRKHMKARSEKITNRAATKHFDMEKVNHFNKKSDQMVTLQYLSELYKAKIQNQGTTPEILKPGSKKLFEAIISDKLVTNPAEIEVIQTLKCIQIRQSRTKILNILNGMRCMHRNICYDLRVMGGIKFRYKLDDEMLINSNKQLIQKFQKAVKDTQTYYSAGQNQNPLAQDQDFIIKGEYNTNLLYKKDYFQQKFYGSTIPHVLVVDGRRPKNYILYQIALQDLKLIEKKMLFVATKCINRYERYLKVKGLTELIDRVETLRNLYLKQLQYLYAKLKLMEQYYYIYQNTSSPLDAFKIAKIIVQLLHQHSEIDSQESYFVDCYDLQIETLKKHQKVLNSFAAKIQENQNIHNKIFHQKYAQRMKIPLTLFGYLYGDLETKNKHKTRLERVNSFVSQKSKTSKDNQINRIINAKQQIKEQFQEDSQESFDIEKYDQYLLQRDMDQIFQDMIQGNQGAKDNPAPVNTVSIQNIVVNPRFQGGPHPHNMRTNKIHISKREQYITAFSDILSWASNIAPIMESLKQQFFKRYGEVSPLYKLAVQNSIAQFANKILVSPQLLPHKWLEFNSDDPYMEIVTKSMRHYQQVLAPAMDPPSQAQMLVHNLLKIHQDKIKPFNLVQFFDYHTLQSYCLLKKPGNTVTYKQLVLGINFLQLLQLKQKLWHVQLERDRVAKAYQTTGALAQCFVQKFGMEYMRGNQDPCFLSIQQLKVFNTQLVNYPIYQDSLRQLTAFLKCQIADLQFFKTVTNLTKEYLDDYIIMKNQVDSQFINSKFDKSRLLSTDAKTLKQIKLRLQSMIATLSNERIKNQSFLKCKANLKTVFEKNLDAISNFKIQDVLLQQERQKLNPNCLIILQQKYKKMLIYEALNCYSKDLLLSTSRNKVTLGFIQCSKKVSKYYKTLPYLQNIFQTNLTNPELQKKVFLDQKKPNFQIKNYQTVISQGMIKNQLYLYTKEQILDQWNQSPHLAQSIQSSQFSIKIPLDLNLPKNKNDLFKWIFRVPTNTIQPAQKEALRHFYKIAQPFTGTLSQSQYITSDFIIPPPPRNKFCTLLQYYQTLLKYIEANVLIISLQLQDDIFDSLKNMISRNRSFQETFPLADDTTIYQRHNQQVLAPCFVYEIKQQKLKEKLEEKIKSRGYMEKKQHWVVMDEVSDFLVSKVQGFGLLRQSFLFLAEELKNMAKNKNFQEFMDARTKNTYGMLYLSMWETFSKDTIISNESDFHHYLLPLKNQLFSRKKIQLFKAATDTNHRFNINAMISNNMAEKERFRIKVIEQGNLCLVPKFKQNYMISSIDIEKYLSIKLQKLHNEETKQGLEYYPTNQYAKGINVFEMMGKKNRMKMFGTLRLHYQSLTSYLKPRLPTMSEYEKQKLKQKYLQFLVQTQNHMLSGVSFEAFINFGLPASQGFRHKYNQIQQINQMNAHIMYDKLQKYTQSNKLTFTKTQKGIIGKDQTGANKEFNKTMKQVIYSKLLKNNIRQRILSYAIKMLKIQKCPTNQSKKILNASLIPRVHLIASYSSPLIVQRKTYISQQYKLAFVQAFTNRFRNKVSRVDLLSSGYGFVITVPDLQDCVNFMNKLLFTFTEKQFQNRSQTFSQYYEIMIDGLNNKNKIIKQQQCIINYLKDKLKDLKQTQYLGKVSKLLLQKTTIEDKLKQVDRNSKGLEDRVRKTVEIQYQKRMQSLQKQNQQLKKQFEQFKKLFVILAKDQTKNNFLGIINTFRTRMSDLLNKKIDFSTSFEPVQAEEKKNQQNKNEETRKIFENNPPQYMKRQQQIPYQNDDYYIRSDIQKCKIGEDIIHDPYYTTKLINKMRLFNLFKLGSKKIKHENQNNMKRLQTAELQKIQDKTITQVERQSILRQQLIKAQQELSRKYAELQQLKNSVESLQNQKTKLKIIITSKDKKIQQKDREIQEFKKQNTKKQTVQDLISLTIDKSGFSSVKEEQQLPRIGAVRQARKSIHKKLQKMPFLTNYESDSNFNSLYEKFELSNKDSTWRQKCQQLYLQNKRLQNQLEKLKTGTTTPHRDSHSLNLKNAKKNIEMTQQLNSSYMRDNKKKFPNLSFKYNIIKQAPNN